MRLSMIPLSQNRILARAQHRSIVTRASKPRLPDRYQVRLSQYGVAIRPFGHVLQSRRITRASRRGCVRSFTASSRRRLLRKLAYLYSPKVVFITLTYPDCPPARKVKRDVDVFGRRLLRRFPRALFVWRMEKQKRGAWHIHILAYGMPFMPWRHFARLWVEVAGLPERALYTSTYLRLVRGGTRALMAYVSKYMAKVDDSDQGDVSGRSDDGSSVCVDDSSSDLPSDYNVPRLPFGEGVSVLLDEEAPGRYWGIIGRKNIALYWYSYTFLVGASDYYGFRRVVWRLRGIHLSLSLGTYLWGLQTIAMRYFLLGDEVPLYRELLPP